MWHGYFDNEKFEVDAHGKLVKTEPAPSPAPAAPSAAAGAEARPNFGSQVDAAYDDAELSPFFDEHDEEAGEGEEEHEHEEQLEASTIGLCCIT